MNDDRWNEMLNVDLTGVMRCFRAATPRLISGGSLVAISSIAGGVYGWQEHAHYAAAKAAVPGFVAHWPLSLHREVFAATP
jgi:3-oxoacyl-[acyl-carrier protein] reductase